MMRPKVQGNLQYRKRYEVILSYDEIAVWEVMVLISILILAFERYRRWRRSAPVVSNGIEKGIQHFSRREKDLGHLRVMEEQLGGLAHAEKELAMLVAPESGLVLKPVQSRGRGEREVAFYEYQRRYPTAVKEFLCEYHGVTIIEKRPYLVLDDCCAGMAAPCTLDIKIGTKTYEDDAPRTKKLREAAKYPPQAKLGCRIVGMRLFHMNGNITMYDKHWGYDVQHFQHFEQKLKCFFSNIPQAHKRQRLIHAFLHQLDTLIHRAFSTQKNNENKATRPEPFVFISSSLFFAYDASFHTTTKELLPTISLRLIDFAHVRSEHRTDTASLVGLQTVAHALRTLLLDTAQYTSPKAPPPKWNHQSTLAQPASQTSTAASIIS